MIPAPPNSVIEKQWWKLFIPCQLRYRLGGTKCMKEHGTRCFFFHGFYQESTHWDRLKHVSFREWLVACTPPSHYLTQCWFNVNWTSIGVKRQWYFAQNSNVNWMKYIWKYPIHDWTPDFSGLGKDGCKTRPEAFEFSDLVHLVLEVRQIYFSRCCHCHPVFVLPSQRQWIHTKGHV